MLAGALNYAAFMAGLAILFLRDAELPDGLLRTIWVGCALGSLLAAPGAFVSIWAWIRADEILKQARTGALPEAVGGPAFRARQQAFVLLGVSAVSLVVQIVALQNVLGATGAHQ